MFREQTVKLCSSIAAASALLPQERWDETFANPSLSWPQQGITAEPVINVGMAVALVHAFAISLCCKDGTCQGGGRQR